MLDVAEIHKTLEFGGLMVLCRIVFDIASHDVVYRLIAALASTLDESLSEALEGPYYDPEDRDPVVLELARRGVGEVGTAQLAPALWNLCVARDLLDAYHRWDRKYALGMSLSSGVRVKKMLGVSVRAGFLKVSAVCHGSSKARVIPNNFQKCSLIFTCVGLNAADSRNLAPN